VDTLAQLDKLMSAEDRKMGSAMAVSLGKTAGTSSFGAASTSQAATQRPVKRNPEKAAPTQMASAEPVKQSPKAAEPAKPAKTAAKPSQPIETASLEMPRKATAKPARVPRAAVAASGAWRIQLGAFSQRGNAEALYRKLAGTGALAGRKPFYVAAGPVTRLQVGPFESKAAAEAACKAVASACFPVPAK
jgi:hypothetical protein